MKTLKMQPLNSPKTATSEDACIKLKSILSNLKRDSKLLEAGEKRPSLDAYVEMASFAVGCLDHSVIDYRILAAVALVNLAENQLEKQLAQNLMERIFVFANKTTCLNSATGGSISYHLADIRLENLLLLDSFGEESPSRVLCLLAGFLSSGLDTISQLAASNHMSLLKAILQISKTYSAIGIVSRLSALAFARWFQASLTPLWKNVISASQDEQFVISRALEFIQIKWEDQCVPQNLLKEIFSNLVVLYGARNPSIIDMVHALPISRIKFEEARLLLLKAKDPKSVLECLGGMNFLQKTFECFSQPSLNSSAVEVVKALGKEYAKRGLDIGSLFSHFIYLALVSVDETSRKITAERILSSIAGFHPSVLNEIVEYLITDWSAGKLSSANQESAQIYYEAFMSLFLAAKMNEFTLQIQVSQPLLYQNLLLDSVCSHSSVLRFSTLAITTYSRQTVKDITSSELKIIKQFLMATGGGETAEMRQDILSHMSKLLDRLKNSVHKHQKIANRLLEKASKLVVGTSEDFTQRKELELEAKALVSGCQEKIEFVCWLREYSLSGLFPGATITRVTTSSSILQLISSKYFGFDGLDCSEQDARRLFWHLVRSFDKQDALALIASEKGFSLGYESLSSKKLVEKSKLLLKSVRAKDLETAATICKFLLVHVFKRPQTGLEEQNEGFRSLFHEYLALLKIHLDEYTQSVGAAQQFPLNGVLSAIR